MPESSRKLFEIFAYTPPTTGIGLDDNGNYAVDQLLPSQHVIGTPEFLFKKIEDADIEKQLGKLATRRI